MNESLADADFLLLLEWLQQRTGLTFRSDQHANTRFVIDRLLKRLQVSHSNELPLALLQRPEVLAALVNELTVGETYFFREPRHFDLLRERLIPDIRDRRGSHHKIRCWSAACASGEEIYSIAIVFDQLKLSSSVHLLATDLSEAALVRAREATYRSWSLRGQDSQAAKPYLQQDGQLYRLQDHLRSMVKIQQQNLAADDYPSVGRGISDMDVIFCRNVLIYFSRQTIADIAQRMSKTLAEGGWLITASGDPPLAEYVDLEAISTPYGLVYQKRVAASSRRSRYVGNPTTIGSSSTMRSDEVLAFKTLPPSEPVAAASSMPSGDSVKLELVGPERPLDRQVGPETNHQESDAKVELTSNLAAAVTALEAGNPQHAAELTERFTNDPTACVIRGRALAAFDSTAALDFLRFASRRHPLKEELHYLAAIQLADANRIIEAVQSLQKVLFLDRSSVLAHFLFGSLQSQLGQWKSARRHFQNVCELCARGKPHEVPPWSNGETLSDLATDAQSQLDRLRSLSVE